MPIFRHPGSRHPGPEPTPHPSATHELTTGERTTGDYAVGERAGAPPLDTRSAADRRLELSATVAGPDGSPLLTVARRSVPTGPGRAAAVIVTATGQIDLETVELLRGALLEAVDGSAQVCCDLSGVDFLGAAGANALVAAHHHATRAGGRLAVRGARDTVRRVLVITGLEGLFAPGC